MDWNLTGVEEHGFTVLVTDIRGASQVLVESPPDLARDFLWQFASLTRRAMTTAVDADHFDINAFLGDGFLIFVAEPRPQALKKVGPGRAVIAAQRMLAEFKHLCVSQDFRAGESRRHFRSMGLVAAISYGPVYYGGLAGDIVPRSTGVTRTVTRAFRLAQRARSGEILVDATSTAKHIPKEYLDHKPRSFRKVRGFGTVDYHRVLAPQTSADQ